MGVFCLTNRRFGDIMHAGYEGLKGLGMGGLAARHYEALIKTLNPPLSSTFLHSYPIKKISVRFIFDNSATISCDSIPK
jgi:hypothetical protein